MKVIFISERTKEQERALLHSTGKVIRASESSIPEAELASRTPQELADIYLFPLLSAFKEM